MGEPTAHGEVVELHEEPGKEDVESHEGESDGPHVGHGAVGLGEAYIGVEEVHKGIVYRVEGIGDVAEEAGHLAVGRTGPGGKPHDKGKDYDEEGDDVEAVLPWLQGRADEGYGKGYQKGRGGDEESEPHFPGGGGGRIEAHKEACHEHTEAIGEEHAYHAPAEAAVDEAPSHAKIAEAEHGIGECQATDEGEKCEKGRRETTQEEGIEHIADVLEEETPVWAVEGIHLAVSSDIGTEAGPARHEEEGHHEGEGYPAGRSVMAAPIHSALNEEGDEAQYGTGNDHVIEAYETAERELAGGEAFLPTPVVGIADDETGEEEEEIDGEIAVVAGLGVDAAAGCHLIAEALVAMIPEDDESGYATEGVKKEKARIH